MTAVKKSKRLENRQRTLRVAGVALVVGILIIGLLPLGTITAPNAPAVNDPLANPAGGGDFPTVPPGGTPIVVQATYFHPSAIFSAPEVKDWQRPGETPDELIVPAANNPLSRAGTTFINSPAASVVHIFVENNPQRSLLNTQDLDSFYTREVLAEAWSRYTGGWKELNRRIEAERIIIDFELYFEQKTYLGRQISQVERDWLKVIRLVAPNNNPGLLDSLQAVFVPGFRLWPAALNAPMNWTSLIDTTAGYVIRYPPDWKQQDGSLGQQFTVRGTLRQESFTLVTRSVAGVQVRSEDEARAWVKTQWPNAVLQSTVPETRGEVSGFSVSYTSPDADGNQRSAVVTLLNGANGALYIANIQAGMGGRDLLDAQNSPAELTQVRSTFFVIPTGSSLASPTPTPAG